MSEQKIEGLRRIRRALLSVSDKTGLIEFARALDGFGIELWSTGGTAQALRGAGLEVRDVAEVTGFPEMLDGRVKTLHPRIHGALLALRDDEAHVRALAEHGIELIDMVVVNLYPFEQTIARAGVTLAEAVEQIDIGGPSMIRSAAKNWRDVSVVTSPAVYPEILEEMRRNDGALSLDTRARLAQQAFQLTSLYDSAILRYLQTSAQPFAENAPASADAPASTDFSQLEQFDATAVESGAATLPASGSLSLRKSATLRYGENPHQVAALYETGERGGVAHAGLLSGKEMSFNNYVDADAAWLLACDFDETTCAIIKHMNPAGVATGATVEEAYRRALATDPVSAFGGIVAFNRTVDAHAARAVTEIFTEVVIAPDYEEAALETLRAKKNLRVLRAGNAASDAGLDFKKISGGMLVQTRDTHRLTRDALKVVTLRAPSEDEINALLFAWTVCKHTKSNAIVYARAGQTVGVGAGQMSRVDSVRLGAMRAQIPVRGSVLASDAFFPFRDGIDEAARHAITAVIQPGGSVRDEEVVAAANEHNMAMVFTGVRHFKH
ncbi:MAG TPA: bifunctional phosphoribosylaminoimidazolecarboxamide formyltransferase/IMP cyclohydrolase [Pyrinomonadaceae bacterium]|jgi:phosphoribosylaminoimidazolecarboxamide formyltransferase/IMP cyclohydrolase|nr:bifunctional phosphoribosylaminoimidazolecarboxamide formyltransferase/IMP cyclohydrolase [Pyrinomonadaceae bacterium]